MNTFPSDDFPSEMQKTWKDRCLDYVIAPRKLLAGASVKKVHIDLCNPHEDHQPLCVQVGVHLRKQKSMGVALAGDVCGSRPRTRPKRKQWKVVVQPGWSCDVHRHAEHIFERARQRKVLQKKCTPRKPFVSEVTWQIIVDKKACLVERRRCLFELRKAVLSTFFRAWRGQNQSARDAATWRVRVLVAGGRLWALTKKLSRMLVLDKRDYIASLVEVARCAIEKGDAKQLWHALRFFRKGGKGFRALPYFVDDAGRAATSREEQIQITAAHFGSLEAAISCDAAQAVSLQREGDVTGAYSFELRDLPSLYALEQGVLQLPRHKAPGPSGICNEQWLEKPAEAARQWFPLVLKTHVRLCEPVRFAAGVLHCLYKGRGVMSRAQNWRSVFLMEGVGKACRKLMRPDLVAQVTRESSVLFQGCKAGSSSAALTHYALTWLKVHKAKGHGSGLLFLDLRAAFYRVLRGRLLGSAWSDEAVCDILTQMHVDPSLFQDVLSWSHGASLLEGMNDHVARVVRSFFNFSAFVLPHEGRLHVSRSGSRPGDALADVLFALVMADAIKAVEYKLQVQCPHMYECPDLVPHQPVWADDACFPFWTHDKGGLVEVAKLVGRVVHSECCRRALEPNYAGAKTELLLVPGGAGALELRKTLFAGSGKLVVEANGSQHHLRLTSSYMHLGTAISDRLSAGLDLRRKLAKGLSMVRPLASKALRREDVPIHKRRDICLALGPHVAGFNCEVWGHLNKEELNAWIQMHDSMYRLVFKDDRHLGTPRFPTVYKVCGAAGFPVPQSRLSAARIMHAERAVRMDNDPLLSLLALEDGLSSNSWLKVLRKDLMWLQYWVPSVEATVSFERMTPDELVVWFSERRLRPLIRKALSEQIKSLAEWTQWQLDKRKKIHERCCWISA